MIYPLKLYTDTTQGLCYVYVFKKYYSLFKKVKNYQMEKELLILNDFSSKKALAVQCTTFESDLKKIVPASHSS